ncbi:MAG TPA: Hpt domain-containing protein [Chitinophagaceae bacterium]|nr:Hpt domain-containing protein [Chitinophagaceae bacterium]
MHVFNNNIDGTFLFSLYGRDKDCLLDVFRSALQQLSAELPVLQKHKEEKDLANLKRSVRKIKPLFGFVGLTKMQSECHEFEEKCEKVDDHNKLEPEYQQFISQVQESASILEMEIDKLRA